MDHPIVWLEAGAQRLGLVPSLGGGVAEWSLQRGSEQLQLWRRWDGQPDVGRLANYALLPWTNRIAGGSFEHAGQRWHFARNRADQALPIHGEGWLLPWTLHSSTAATAELRLSARHHQGSPYAYDAVQTYALDAEGSLVQTVSITHRAGGTLPYGLGLHPWFPRTPQGTVRARVRGAWLSGEDRISTEHVATLSGDWNLNDGVPQANASFVDNAFTGWDGQARIHWPEHGLAVAMTMAPLQTPQGPVAPEYCLMYRPGFGDAFCFEPVTHPVDAFHLPGRPGLVELGTDQTLTCEVRWRVVADSASHP